MIDVRTRFWVEGVLAGSTALLAVVTAAWHDWIEIIFGVDPDHGNGSLEWLFVAVMAVAAISFAALARAEWRSSA